MDKSKLSFIANRALDAAETIRHLEGDSSLTVELEDAYYYLKKLIGESVDKNKKKKIYNHTYMKSYGEVGQYTGYKDYHVGDMVYCRGSYGESKYLVINNEESFSIYGWGKVSLKILEDERGLTPYKKYNKCTKKDLLELTHYLTIK